jgi:hypothetical protein
VAKGKKSAFAARALALVFAVALAALAARLWIGSAPRETSATRPVSGAPAGGVGADAGAVDGVPDAVATAPPQHEPYSAKDREALREAIRDAENQAP